LRCFMSAVFDVIQLRGHWKFIQHTSDGASLDMFI
jgi:hypothetical protein